MSRLLALVLALLALTALSAPLVTAVEAKPLRHCRIGFGYLIDVKEAAPGFRLHPRQAKTIARRDPRVQRYLKAHPGLIERALPGRGSCWIVTYSDGWEERLKVAIHDQTGQVDRLLSGPVVRRIQARGNSSIYGGRYNTFYGGVFLGIIFFLAFFQWRRPWQLKHLDLVILLGFGLGQLFFNQARIHAAIPITFCCLAYLTLRMGLIALGRARPAQLQAQWSGGAMMLAALLLLGWRTGLNLVDSQVIDIGFSSVVGADLVGHGQGIYGSFPRTFPHSDAYAPFSYYAYLPFEWLAPYVGQPTKLLAAHLAAIGFDLLVVSGLFQLGRQLAPKDGNKLAVTLAFAWLAYPFTTFNLLLNTNDALMAALMVWAMVAWKRGWLSGILLGLAAMTKFVPLILLPVWTMRLRQRSHKQAWFFLGATLATITLVMLPTLIGPGLGTFWEKTLGFQGSRAAIFSFWGMLEAPWLQRPLILLAALASIALALVPRKASAQQTAAAGAALIMAMELTSNYWFYNYLIWATAFILLALIASPTSEREQTARRNRQLTRDGVKLLIGVGSIILITSWMIIRDIQYSAIHDQGSLELMAVCLAAALLIVGLSNRQILARRRAGGSAALLRAAIAVGLTLSGTMLAFAAVYIVEGVWVTHVFCDNPCILAGDTSLSRVPYYITLNAWLLLGLSLYGVSQLRSFDDESLVAKEE